MRQKNLNSQTQCEWMNLCCCVHSPFPAATSTNLKSFYAFHPPVAVPSLQSSLL